MSIAGLDGVLLQVNDSLCSILGWERSELIGKPLFDLIHPDDQPYIREASASALTNDQGYTTIEERCVRKDGQVVWVRVSASVVRDDSGSPAAFVSILEDITEQKRAVEAVAQSEDLFRSVVESTLEIITILGADGTIKYESPAIRQVLGYEPEELVGSIAFDFIHPEDAGRIREAIDAHLQGGPAPEFAEYRFRHKNGTWRNIESLARGMLGHPAVQGFVVASRDVTERRLSEQELRASRERLELATDVAQIGFWDVDLVTGHRETSPADRAFYGFESTPATVEEWLLSVHPDDRDEARARIARLYAGEAPFEMEFRAVRPDGSVRWLAGRSSMFRDETGRPLRVIGVNRDITERKLAAIELEKRQQEFQTLVENLPDIIVRMDANLRITYASPRVSKLGIAEYAGKTWEEAGLPHTISALIRQKAVAALQSGAERRFEFRVSTGSQPAIFEGRIIPEPHGGGAISLLAIMSDISRRKQIEAMVRESEERFRNAFSHAATGIAIADPDQRLISVNKAYAALTGYSEAELIGRRFLDITHPDDIEPQRAALVDLIAGRRASVVLEKRYIRKDSSIVWARNSISRQLAGGAVNLVSICEDITERKKAEADRQRLHEQLLHAQKMEAVGRLAGGIAHDFNNLLTVILGYGAIVRRKLEEGELAGHVDQILSSADRAASLTNQLLAFSRKQMLQPRRINLNDELRSMEEMIRRLIGEDVNLVIDLDPELGAVQADPGQIGQVIMNLAVNARDAMPAGGTLTITTQNSWVANTAGDVQAVATVTVTDTGIGMSNEVRKKIFDPFFTTKEIGKGTGLGLPMVLGIVEQSGGSIEVSSEVGEGSSFSIRLPHCGVTQDPEAPVRAPEFEAAAARILLVEDEQAVRRLAAQILADAGYQVRTASRGVQALEIAAAEDIDLLVTDVVMPVMNGPEVAAAIRKLQPETPVLFMSGYSEHPAILHSGADAGHPAAFVQKPFTADQFLAAVVEALAHVANIRRSLPGRRFGIVKPNAEQA